MARDCEEGTRGLVQTSRGAAREDLQTQQVRQQGRRGWERREEGAKLEKVQGLRHRQQETTSLVVVVRA